ncbi:MAG: hypothetical protein WD272_02430 [Balneolales bacterium]
MGTISYIKNFLSDRHVASITPTSRFTIERICENIDFDNTIKMIEYGPADGVVTKIMLENLSLDSKIMAIETNENFISNLHKIKDGRLMVSHNSAEDVGAIAEKKNWNSVDYIISGIPFSFIDDPVKHKILKESAKLLKQEGCFVAYQTSSHLIPYLKEYFEHVVMEKVFLNIPPMFIYVANNQVR